MRIQNFRYNEKDYFWLNDLTPRMIMHPYKPELNGKDLPGEPPHSEYITVDATVPAVIPIVICPSFPWDDRGQTGRLAQVPGLAAQTQRSDDWLGEAGSRWRPQ
jgi:hypothetical protein